MVHGVDTANADHFTNGFSKTLVADIVQRLFSAHTRLIPEMSFTCNGTIVGFTVAGRQRRQLLMDPIIQVWRGNRSQSDVYYKTSSDIVINEAVCAETSIVFQEPNGNDNNQELILQCTLNKTNQVSVQPGDILGLQLPQRDESPFRLDFVRVSRGPTSYVFEQQVLSSPAVLYNANLTNQELPQIALQVESGMCSGCLYHATCKFSILYDHESLQRL